MDRSGRQQVVDLDPARAETIVGRHPDCDLCTPDASVSRRHCVITYDGGQYHVSDLGSANGTLVNDVRISRRHLSTRDIVRCGSLILQFFDDEVAPGLGAMTPTPRPRYGLGVEIPETAIARRPDTDAVNADAELEKLRAFNRKQSERMAQLQDELLEAERRAENTWRRAAASEQDAAALRTRVQLLETAADEREEVLRSRESELARLSSLAPAPNSGLETMDLPSMGSIEGATSVAMPVFKLDGPLDFDDSTTAQDVGDTLAAAELSAKNEALEAELSTLRAQLVEAQAEAEAARLPSLAEAQTEPGQPEEGPEEAEAPTEAASEALAALEGEVAQRDVALAQLRQELDASRAGAFATDAERLARLAGLENEIFAAEARADAADRMAEQIEAEARAWLKAAGHLLGQAETRSEALNESLELQQSQVARVEDIEAELSAAREMLTHLDEIENELVGTKNRASKAEHLEDELTAARELLDGMHDLEKDLATAQRKIQALEGIEAELSASREMVRRLDSIEAQLGDAQGRLQTYEDMDDELSRARDELAAIEAGGESSGFEERASLTHATASLRDELKSARTAEKELRAKLSEVQVEARNASKARKELRELKQQLTDVDTQRAAMAQNLRQNFERVAAAEARVQELETQLAQAKDPTKHQLAPVTARGRKMKEYQARIAQLERDLREAVAGRKQVEEELRHFTDRTG